MKKFLILVAVCLLMPKLANAQATSTISTDIFSGKIFSADCGQIGEGLLANSCYAKKALGNLDCSICEKVNWFGGKVSCCMAVVNDYPREGICNNILDIKLKEKCLSHLAAKTNNVSLCKNIEDKTENFACRMELAKKVTDLKKCEKMPKAEKNYCLLQIAQTSKNENLCSKIGDNFVRRFCYGKLALIKNNEKLCNFLKLKDKDTCLSQIAQKRKDGKLCAQIKDGSVAGYCLDRIAVAKKDVKVCDFIKGSYKYDCIFDVSKVKDSAVICEKITDKVKNYQCVTHFAVARELSSYCEYLKDKTKEGLCVDEVEKQQTARVQDMQRLSDLKVIQTAIELYFTDNKVYPEGDKIILGGQDSICLIGSGIFGENWNCNPNATTTYLTKIPADPVNTGIYVYEYTKTTGDTPCYNLTARLETNYDIYKTGPILASCDGKIVQ